jgi:hypothetical protein
VSCYGLDNNAFILYMGRDFVSSAICETTLGITIFYPVGMGVLPPRWCWLVVTSGNEVKNVWMCTSIFSHVLKARCLIWDRGNFICFNANLICLKANLIEYFQNILFSKHSAEWSDSESVPCLQIPPDTDLCIRCSVFVYRGGFAGYVTRLLCANFNLQFGKMA